MTKTIAFIGAGNMARAMMTGLLKNGFDPKTIWASSPGITKHAQFAKDIPIHTTTDNCVAAKNANVIVFAVKPWMMESVCPEIQSIVQEKNPLIISFVTGVTTKTISQYLNAKNAIIVRTMPNVASAVGAGTAGLFATSSVGHEQRSFAESFFRSVGATVWVKQEDQLDVITAVSGSGP